MYIDFGKTCRSRRMPTSTERMRRNDVWYFVTDNKMSEFDINFQVRFLICNIYYFERKIYFIIVVVEIWFFIYTADVIIFFILRIFFILIDEASRGEKNVIINATGYGFDPTRRCYFFFIFFALVLSQSAALSSATQHATPPELGGNWETEWLIRFPLPTLLRAEYSVKLI